MTLSEIEQNKKEVFTRLRIASTKKWLNNIKTISENLTELKTELQELETKHDTERYSVPCGISTDIRSGATPNPTQRIALRITHDMDKERKGLQGDISRLEINKLRNEIKLIGYKNNEIISDKQYSTLFLYYSQLRKISEIAKSERVTEDCIKKRKNKAIERISECIK